MRTEHYNLSKKPYIRPQIAFFALMQKHGLLQSLSLPGAQNASENGNPPMDVKGYAGDWSEIWDE